MPKVVTDILGWVGETFEFFTKEPVIYFVGVALVGAIFGISKKIMPMKRR